MKQTTYFLNPHIPERAEEVLGGAEALNALIRQLCELRVLVQQDPNTLISTKDAAPYIGFSPDTVKKHRYEQLSCTPPYIRLGARSVRYRIADLLEYQVKYRITHETEGESHENN